MDNRQKPENNSHKFFTDFGVVNKATGLLKTYPQTFTNRFANSQQVLEGLSTEKRAFIYDYYFLKVKTS